LSSGQYGNHINHNQFTVGEILPCCYDKIAGGPYGAALL
jgi:hypothetical protein